MEDYADNITAERIKRVIKWYGDKKWTWWWFDYYTLWEALFDEDDNLNESIDTEIIKQYIRYTETQTDYTPSSKKYLLGTYKRTEYYFYYEHDRATTLDLKFLGTLWKTDSYRLIYADICLLSKAFLAKHNIIFKKIPRDITRF
jgi:adenine-specific DNA-methyltransferase